MSPPIFIKILAGIIVAVTIVSFGCKCSIALVHITLRVWGARRAAVQRPNDPLVSSEYTANAVGAIKADVGF